MRRAVMPLNQFSLATRRSPREFRCTQRRSAAREGRWWWPSRCKTYWISPCHLPDETHSISWACCPKLVEKKWEGSTCEKV